MIELEGIELPDNLVMADEFSWTGVQTVSEKSAGGRSLIWEQAEENRPITLKGTTDKAWIKRDILELLHKFARIPGAIYVLKFEGDVYNVRFRNEDGSPVTAIPRNPRPNYKEHSVNSEYHSLEIKLMIM